MDTRSASRRTSDELKAALAPFGTKSMTLVGSFESP